VPPFLIRMIRGNSPKSPPRTCAPNSRPVEISISQQRNDLQRPNNSEFGALTSHWTPVQLDNDIGAVRRRSRHHDRRGVHSASVTLTSRRNLSHSLQKEDVRIDLAARFFLDVSRRALAPGPAPQHGRHFRPDASACRLIRASRSSSGPDRRLHVEGGCHDHKQDNHDDSHASLDRSRNRRQRWSTASDFVIRHSSFELRTFPSPPTRGNYVAKNALLRQMPRDKTKRTSRYPRLVVRRPIMSPKT
jgi:hypothetical protein